MAELLIVAQSHHHPDPVEDRAGAYKRGDVVDVREDGFDWGRLLKSYWPKFAVVKIPGVSVASVEKYIRPEMNSLAPDQVLTRRLYRLEIDTIPLAVRRALKRDGTVTLTKAQVLKYLRNKATGALEA